MTDNDLDRFARALLVLASAYEKTVTADASEMWFDDLREFDIDAVIVAFRAHRRDPDRGRWMPRVADIIGIIEGSREDAGLRAWSQVMKTIARHGGGPSIVFDDAITMRVIAEMGGWSDLCAKDQAELTFKGHEFGKRYRSAKLSTAISSHPAVLHGRFDQHNLSGGFKSDPPVLIGDKDKALQVLETGEQAFPAVISLTLDGPPTFRESQGQVARRVKGLIGKKPEGPVQ